MSKLPTNAPNVNAAKRLPKKPSLVGKDGRVKKARASANAKPLGEGEWLWEDGVVTDDYGNPIIGPVRDESGKIVGYTSRDGQTVVKEAYDMVVRGNSPDADMPDAVDASDPAALNIAIPEVVDGEVQIVAPEDPKVAASAPEVPAAASTQGLARKVNDLGGSILNRLDVDNQEFINQAADEIMRQFDASGNPSPQMQLLLADPVMKERLDAIISRATDDVGAPPSPGAEGPDPYTGETPDQRGLRRLADEEQKISRQGAYAIPGNKRRRERLEELGLAPREAPLAQKPRYEGRSPIQNDKGPVSQKKAGRESQRDTAAALARTVAGFGADPRARANVAMGVEERAAVGDARLTNPVVSTDAATVPGSRQGSGLTSDLQQEVGGGITTTTPESSVTQVADRRPQLQAIIDNLDEQMDALRGQYSRGEVNEFYLKNELDRLQGAQRTAAGMWLDLDTKLRAIVPDSGISGVAPDASTVTMSGPELEDISIGRLSRNRGLRQKVPESRRAAALRALAQEARGTAMVPGKNSIVINDGENPVAFLPTQPDFLWEKVPVKDENGKIVGSRWEPSWNARRGESALVQRPVRYDMPIEWFVGDGPGLTSADEFVQHIARLGGYHDVLMKSPLAQDAIRQMMDVHLFPDSPIYGNRDLFRSTGTGGPSSGDWVPELGPVGADAVYDELGRLRNPVPLIGDSADGPAPRFTSPGMRQPPGYNVDQLVSMREQLARQREALVKRAEDDGADDLIPRASAIQGQIRDIDARIRAATGGGPNTPSPTMELSPEQMDHFREALADYNERWSAASDWIGDTVDAPKPGGRQTMGEFDAQSATDAARRASPDFEDALPAEADRKALGGAGYANLPYFPTAEDISNVSKGTKNLPATPSIPTVVDGTSTPASKGRKKMSVRELLDAAKAGKAAPGTTPTPPPNIPQTVDGTTAPPPPGFAGDQIDGEIEQHFRDWFNATYPGGTAVHPDFDSYWNASGEKILNHPDNRAASMRRMSGGAATIPPVSGATPGAAATPAAPGATAASGGASPSGSPTPAPAATPAAGGGGAGSPPPPNIPANAAGATPGAPAGKAGPGVLVGNNLAPVQNPQPQVAPRRLRDLINWRNGLGAATALTVGGLAAKVRLDEGPETAEMLERLDGAGPFGPTGGMPPGGFPPGGVEGEGFSDPLENDRAARMARALQLIQDARVPRYQTAQNFTGGTYYR